MTLGELKQRIKDLEIDNPDLDDEIRIRIVELSRVSDVHDITYDSDRSFHKSLDFFTKR